MAVPGTAEPDALPFLKFRLDSITAQSPLPNPTTVVRAGQPLHLNLELGVEGLWTGFLEGENFSVFHHVERIEDGNRSTLPGGSNTVPSPPTNFNVTTGPYTTGNPGSGAQFEIASGFDAGTFRILTHIHFDNPLIEPIVAAFHEMVVMVT